MEDENRRIVLNSIWDIKVMWMSAVMDWHRIRFSGTLW